MVMRTGGPRRKSRHKLSKHYRTKGKVSVSSFLQKLNEGDRVVLAADPSIQQGIYHGRFHSKRGEIVGKQGRCYKVKILDGGNEKFLLIHPVHLKKVA